eukprot:gb/GEZN01017798.1/.p1 GENE.gb/GEZN01017798.1/~~gb/GEZN01017798.1/.p1  ORF type:complete len:201 (-),score=19.03 gb/GEZN01017798.1/:67-669(-)
MSVDMLMVPAVMMGLKYLQLDYEEEKTLMYIRIMYGVVQVLTLLSYAFIFLKIVRQNNAKTIEVTEGLSMSERLEDAHRVQEAKDKGKVLQPAMPKLVKMSVREYDLSELKKGVGQVALGLGITCLLHLKFKFVQPLVLQSVLGPVRTWKTPLFALHVLGVHKKRPFPTPTSPFAALTGETNPTKKQIKRAAKKTGGKSD